MYVYINYFIHLIIANCFSLLVKFISFWLFFYSVITGLLPVTCPTSIKRCMKLQEKC